MRSVTRLAGWYAALALGFYGGLFYYWFSVSDRYALFLYEHLGAALFDAITRSRYWMAGLVASGAWLLIYALINFVAGRICGWLQRPYVAPEWWRVWLWCALPLGLSIALITMRCNWPTLPLGDALACVAATWIGLALALSPGTVAARQPTELIWLTIHGAGLVPVLLLMRAIELPAQGLITGQVAYGIAIGSIVGGAVWLALWTGLRVARRRLVARPEALLCSGLCQSYLLMPLIHHVLFVPAEYRYISASANFFASSTVVQLLSWLIAALLVAATGLLGKRLLKRRGRNASPTQ